MIHIKGFPKGSKQHPFQHQCIRWIIQPIRQRILDLLQSLFLFWTLLFESFGRWAGIAYPCEEYCLQNQSSILDITPHFSFTLQRMSRHAPHCSGGLPSLNPEVWCALPSLAPACAPLRQGPLCHTSLLAALSEPNLSGHRFHHSPTAQAGRQGSAPGASATRPPRHSWGWLLGPAAGWAHSACCLRQWSWLPDVSDIFMWPPCCRQPARLGHQGLEDDTAGAIWYYGLAGFLESHLSALGVAAVRQAPAICRCTPRHSEPSPQWAPPPSQRLSVTVN